MNALYNALYFFRDKRAQRDSQRTRIAVCVITATAQTAIPKRPNGGTSGNENVVAPLRQLEQLGPLRCVPMAYPVRCSSTVSLTY